ncbi:MAG: hypothetical protein EXR08_12605 [Alphaproteobacteria bacterium]|nr:hypothetical protein [Alphaproteobacteria bacterium]
MEILVTYLTRRKKGGVSRRTEERSAEALHFGRSTNAEVYLADPRIRFEHAVIHHRPGGLFIEVEKLSDVRVNGQTSSNRSIGVGDVLGIGPFDVTLVEPPEGKDISIEVELVRPLGDDYAQLAARSTVRLEDYGLSRRLWSWVGFLAVLILFLALPAWYFFQHTEASAEKTVGRRFDAVWNSGPISSQHQFISDKCNICHEKPFVQVRDSACLSCHAPVTHHFDGATAEISNVPQFRKLPDKTCNDCHQEHNGSQAVTISKESFCIECHKDIERKLPQSSIKNAGRFDLDHPDFRPDVVTDSAARTFNRISISNSAELSENSGLKFPHDAHLKKDGIRGPNGKETLECRSCHILPRGAANFNPIGMEGTCERCHQLVFDPRRPDRTLPHGQANNAQMLIREFYSDYALRGGVNDVQAPAPDITRQRPGEQTPVTSQRQTAPLAWADQQAQRVADMSFGKTMCGNCHEVSSGSGKGPLNWSVVPALINKAWLPRGRFDHSAHSDMLECDSCHAAETSKKSSDVLLPKIAVCKNCHGGENVSNKVPSTCITCHDFHLPGTSRMGNTKAWRKNPDGEAGEMHNLTSIEGKN